MADNDTKRPKPVQSLGEVLSVPSLRPDELTKSREELLKESKREIHEGLHLMADGVRLFLALHPAMDRDEKNAFIGQIQETHVSVERIIRTMEIDW